MEALTPPGKLEPTVPSRLLFLSGILLAVGIYGWISPPFHGATALAKADVIVAVIGLLVYQLGPILKRISPEIRSNEIAVWSPIGTQRIPLSEIAGYRETRQALVLVRNNGRPILALRKGYFLHEEEISKWIHERWKEVA